jgi:hypothetical protein
VVGSEASGNEETLKRPWPTVSLAPTLEMIAEKEWIRLPAAK